MGHTTGLPDKTRSDVMTLCACVCSEPIHCHTVSYWCIISASPSPGYMIYIANPTLDANCNAVSPAVHTSTACTSGIVHNMAYGLWTDDPRLAGISVTHYMGCSGVHVACGMWREASRTHITYMCMSAHLLLCSFDTLTKHPPPHRHVCVAVL